jgi:cytochrome c2
MSPRSRLSLLVLALVVITSSACSGRQRGGSATKAVTLSPELAKPALTGAALEPGNAEHGQELIRKYQCNRCHEGTGEAPAERNAHCVSCHQQILAGTFPAAKDKLERWKAHVGYVRVVPSLVGARYRLNRDFIARFLLAPYDVRPLLAPSMPRLELSPEDARDIATALTVGQESSASAPSLAAQGAADPRRGRALLEARGCGNCHQFSRVPALPQVPNEERASQNDALLLAPDLVHVRERWALSSLVRWLRDPRALKADTLMPPTGLDEAQARDVASYLLGAPLAPAPILALSRRLPALERRVTFAEVDEKVLRVTCRHCHGNPDSSLGDGGPGNTGGLGFSGRAIDFSSYRGTLSGYRDAKHERRSLFEPLADGTPRLVAALLARQDEEAGKARADVRGMPLGLPALSSEQIQLVDTWIAQGRPE